MKEQTKFDSLSCAALALLPALVLGLSAVGADERAQPMGALSRRNYTSRPIQAAALATTQRQDIKQEAKPAPVRSEQVRYAPVQTAQIDSHGRYPFGQFRGGYRYPFSYPYYRYGGTRHYPYSSGPYSFGVGPYGPYDSNYGGYSGNAYDPQVYGRPLSNGPSMPDAPPGAPPADPVPPVSVTPPVDRAPSADRTPLPYTPRSDAAEGEVLPSPSLPSPGLPSPSLPSPSLHPPYPAIGSQEYGGPPVHFSGNPLGLIYGGVPAFGPYPYGFYNNPLFGQNPLSGGFGVYQPQVNGDSYAPPSGPGFYRPAYVPNYSGFSGRNYGPTYPAVGGINLGPGYYSGW